MSESAPSWRSLLPGGEPSGTPLALGIELRQRSAPNAAHWEPRRFEAVTPRALARRQDDLAVGLRPLVPGASGGWVKGDVSWDAVRRTPERFVGAQARWFVELFSIAHDLRTTGPFASVSEWVTLDTVASGLLWRHLADAATLGIPLVATQRQQTVSLAPRAEVGLDVTAVGGGALRLAARMQVDGAEVPAGTVRPVGRTGFYSFTLARDPIALTLAAAPLTEGMIALLDAPDGVVVPAAETAEFFRDVYPALARETPVTATGVRLPDPAQAVLRVTAAFASGDVVDYRLEWLVAGLPAAPFANVPDVRADRIATAVEEAWAETAELPFAPAATLRDVDAAEFADRILPALSLVEGVRVETSGARREYHRLVGDPRIVVRTMETADPDWFDLGILVTIDGRTIPFSPLFRALSRGRRRMMLSDGAYFSLSHPALARLRELLDEAGDLHEWEAGPRIARTQTTLWADFEDLADEAEPAVAWRTLVRALDGVTEVPPTPLPAGLRAGLRPYQRAGYDWLAFLWRHGLGGILADDMGLGKTVQTLALLAHVRETGERRPVLVVAPTSMIGTWRSEAERFTPDLVVRTIEATRASSSVAVADAAQRADVVVTSYAVLRLDEAEFAGMTWAGVVLDEAQAVKNPRTRLHRAVKALTADRVVAITGTPLENGLEELWALLSLTAPGLFPSARRFREEYVGPIEKGKVPDNSEGGAYRAARLQRLRRRIRPLVMRRTKELVAPELPPTQEQDLVVELAPAHRALYDTVLQRERQKVLGLLDDLDRNRFIVLRSLTLLRMLSLAPVLVDPADARLGSAKLDALLSHAAELAAEGHRALVFSQFTSFLRLAAERMDEAGIAYEWLDGSTTRRPAVIDSFRRGDAPVFLISLKAGGVGLTLTEADYVFLLDPWWNPAAEAQATGRTHRIGQSRSVFVYRLIAAGTIEEKVRAMQQRKDRLFRAVLDDDDLFAQELTADDIRGLFDA